MTADRAWVERAACRGVNPALFFAERGLDAFGNATAKAVCARCDVRGECLSFAVENVEPFGIWGGLSPKERRHIRARRAA